MSCSVTPHILEEKMSCVVVLLDKSPVFPALEVDWLVLTIGLGSCRALHWCVLLRYLLTIDWPEILNTFC